MNPPVTLTATPPSVRLADLSRVGLERLAEEDAELYHLLEREVRHQSETLAMVAASSIADPSVLVCEGLAATNVTTEGYPGARFHAGCEVVDEIERLAVERARRLFGARYANVQPHSGTSANQVVLFSLLSPGDTLLGLDLDAGGHLTHGAKPSVTGRYFRSVAYGLTPEGRIDYEQVRALAHQHRPRLIICGASAYPREIDFARFRAIADEVGAFVLADISHIAGLVAAGLHPSPIDHAHFTTTSTYKQLYGPRGGLVLMGRDHVAPAPGGKGTLSDLVQRAVFPYFQGTPNLSAIAAKAAALARAATPRFRALARRVADDARTLAALLAGLDYRVLTGGTDNHIVLVDILQSKAMTGVIAEQALEACHVFVNKNRIPGDRKSARVTSGMRIGTNSLALRGMGPGQMESCAALIDNVLSAVTAHDDRSFTLDPDVATACRTRVQDLCRRFPYEGYPGG